MTTDHGLANSHLPSSPDQGVTPIGVSFYCHYLSVWLSSPHSLCIISNYYTNSEETNSTSQRVRRRCVSSIHSFATSLNKYKVKLRSHLQIIKCNNKVWHFEWFYFANRLHLFIKDNASYLSRSNYVQYSFRMNKNIIVEW